MIFGYARVSTKTQARDGNSLDAQQAALTAAGRGKNIHGHVHRHQDGSTGMGQAAGAAAARRCADRDTARPAGRGRCRRASGLITEMIDEGITINVLNLASCPTIR